MAEPDFRTIFEAAPARYVVLSPHAPFRIVDASNAYLEMAAITRAEIIGHAISELVQDDALMGSLARVVRDHKADRMPIWRSGDRSIQVVNHPLFDARGELAYLLHHAEDVTELETARHLATAMTAVSEAIGGLPEASVAAVLETIALQARSITNADYAAVGIGNDPAVPFKPWIAVGISAKVADAIGRTPRPVGTLGVVAAHGAVLRIDNVREHPSHRGFPAPHPMMTSFLGVPIRYRGRAVGNLYLADKRGGEPFTTYDEGIVEMLAARTAAAIETARLYHAEGMGHAWLKAVVDQMPEGVVLMDAEGRLTPNRRAAIQLGEPPVFELRLPSGEVVRAEDLPNVRAFQRSEITSGGEFLLRQPDEAFIPVLISAAPIRDRGTVVGATMIIEDISAMKEVERLREEWASIIAHDLKQPVNTIAIAAQLLSKSALARAELVKPVGHIRTAVSRLTRMIDDLLDATRLEAHRLVVEPRDVLLAPFVDEVVERMATIGDRIVRDVPRDLHVWADPRRLEQVFVNLLTNAQKYGEPNTPIRIEARPTNGEIEIAVANRGAGIPAEELPVLFSRFTRARAAARSGVTGLGLGLYICKGLVQAHGGRISVESEPHGTTRFRFTLSRPEAQPLPFADRPPVAPARAPRRRRQSPRP